ncbi:hypothetical protein HYC85_003983 [Camellia sinensis]|uniref:Uncharacterized protein n=1 Tax=Camellia sinensis TaxID=4442 RepID=A0A7J7HXW0_CAMSI|nr:hypothetical protein HYC85_003983 [Camellia sinensis]
MGLVVGSVNPSSPLMLRCEDERNLIHISVKCATALLEGRLGIDPKTYGPCTDITWDYHVNKAYNGLLPLELAFAIMRTSLYMHSSSPEQSAFNLISVELAIAKLLAWFSKDIEELAYHYAMEGKLIELAMLLIVAQEDVLVPITFHGKDGAEYNFVCENNQLPCVQRKHVEKDIALRLVEAGFNLKAGDLDFSSRDWFIFFDSPTKYIETRLEDKLSQSWSPRLPMLQQTNVFSPPQAYSWKAEKEKRENPCNIDQ